MRIFHAGEKDLDDLSAEGSKVKSVLLISSGMVEIGESSERGEHFAAGVSYLNREFVESGGRAGLGRVDMEPETE